MSPYEKIIELLRTNGAWFEELKHEPVYTSEQAAAVRGMDKDRGAKSILFKSKNGFVLAVVPGSEKISFKKLKDYLRLRQIRMATPEEVEEQMGVKIGACYPFGNVANLRTLVDKALAKHEVVSCNPGRHDVSLKFKFADYRKLAAPELVDIAG